MNIKIIHKSRIVCTVKGNFTENIQIVTTMERIKTTTSEDFLVVVNKLQDIPEKEKILN